MPAPDDAIDIADSAVELLLEAGWHPGNIALLTTGSRHPVQVELTNEDGTTVAQMTVEWHVRKNA